MQSLCRFPVMKYQTNIRYAFKYSYTKCNNKPNKTSAHTCGVRSQQFQLIFFTQNILLQTVDSDVIEHNAISEHSL